MTQNAEPYAVPAWRVVLDGTDLTERFKPRLLELTLTESRGGEADQLDLVIHDHDGRMALPRRGVALSVAIGWEDAGLIEKGTFRVDEVEHSGAPDVITVRARSADLSNPMRTRRERSWHQVTLGDVIRSLAGEHGLQARIAPALTGVQIAHLDQTGESDVHLLTRLGQRYDAVATVKAGSLLFMPIGSGTTASGQALPTALITRASGDKHRYGAADRDSYSGVRAYWNNKPGANRKSVLVGASGNAKRLRETYNNETEAREHANAEWKRIKRGAAKMDFTLALGRADLSPEQKLRLRGFKPEIDDTAWLIAKTTHTITSSAGFTTKLELETDAGGGS
ncbi:phage late control D family protein [Lysobacter capsici]|uniref:phage late control D family protein n=1 Tax=Lysobacter capsici TaxID=435897 RepID=UPI0017862F0F|nr:phage late control D family protein [Lysobacter capsici]UOF16449.1 phage late control D family protein [Lysobacter capsici]